MNPRCKRCGRPLKTPKAIALGMGKICAQKSGTFPLGRNAAKRALAIVMAERGELRPASEGLHCKKIDNKYLINIPHLHRHHSPSGLSWGYAGSGPANLALNVLAYFWHRAISANTGLVGLWDGSKIPATAWMLHQQFKEDVISKIPNEGGFIPAQQIVDWIERCELAVVA